MMMTVLMGLMVVMLIVVDDINECIIIGAGTEIAIDAADMVLVRSNLHDLVVALDLAKMVFRRIKNNFLWATVYNLVAIPYAAGVSLKFAQPTICN